MTLCTFSKTWVTVDLTARSVGACCRTDHIDVDGDIDINNEWFTSLRSNLANGVKDERCNACWKQEKTVGTSLRLNGPFTLTTDETKPLQADLQYLEIRLGNQCDGACVYCGGMFSAKQAKFWKLHLDIDKPVKREPMLEETKKLIIDNRNSIKQIVFLGGEPTLMESWYSFLDFLLVQEFANQVTVVITSNCNWTDKIKQRFFTAVEAFLAKGGKLDIRISGEGDRQYFNGIRKFSDYDTVSKNILDMVARFQNRIKYTLQPVLNGLSVYSMKSWLELNSGIFIDHGVNKVNLNFAMLTRPYEFLTIHQGTKAIPSLNELRDYLGGTELFNPKQRMVSVVDSQISLLTGEPNEAALASLATMLEAHDKILPHTWSSTDALS